MNGLLLPVSGVPISLWVFDCQVSVCVFMLLWLTQTHWSSTGRCRESIPVPHSPKHHPLQFEIHPVNISRPLHGPCVYLLSTRIIYTRTHSYQRTSYSVGLKILFNTHTYIFTPGIISAFSILMQCMFMSLSCVSKYLSI